MWENNIKPILGILLIMIAIYFSVAGIAFKYRNPWATDAEVIMNIGKLLRFEKADYYETKARQGLFIGNVKEEN